MQPTKELDLFVATFQVETFTLSVLKCEMLIIFISDGVLTVVFSKKSFHNFQVSILFKYEYTKLPARDTKYLLPFPTTLICELGFFFLLVKAKVRKETKGILNLTYNTSHYLAKYR